MDNVPRSYCRYVHYLDLCTESNARSSDPRSITEVVISILAASPCLEELVLRTGGSLHHSIISCFGHLSKLERLSIHNSGPEDLKPLYVVCFRFWNKLVNDP